MGVNVRAKTVEEFLVHRREAIANGRKCYVRFGEIPEEGLSSNNRSGEYEDGVSVYPAYELGGIYHLDLECLHHVVTYQCIECDGRPLYEVEGTPNGTGGDGEPVLINASGRRLPDDVQYREI